MGPKDKPTREERLEARRRWQPLILEAAQTAAEIVGSFTDRTNGPGQLALACVITAQGLLDALKVERPESGLTVQFYLDLLKTAGVRVEFKIETPPKPVADA